MILELFILIEVIMVIMFFISFFTKQEIIWGATMVIAGLLMITSFNVQMSTYEFVPATGAYAHVLVTNSFPFMMGFNMIFFALALVLGLFDLFDKYGISTFNFKGKK
jgi:hypothetical protein